MLYWRQTSMSAVVSFSSLLCVTFVIVWLFSFLTAKDFISCLMEKDPAKRFTCEQASRHPWWETHTHTHTLCANKEPLYHYIYWCTVRSVSGGLVCAYQDRWGYSSLQEHPWVSQQADQKELRQEQMEGKFLSAVLALLQQTASVFSEVNHSVVKTCIVTSRPCFSWSSQVRESSEDIKEKKKTPDSGWQFSK